MTSKGDAAALLLRDVLIPFYEPVERLRSTSAYAVHTDNILDVLVKHAIEAESKAPSKNEGEQSQR